MKGTDMNKRVNMSKGKILVGLLLVIVVAAGALGTAWYVRHRRAVQVCALCSRPVHAQYRAMAERNGKNEQTCCITCALAMRAQLGKKARLVTVTDYDTRRELGPAAATYVVGSSVHTCADAPTVKVDETKHAMERHHDRCEPSILAFATRERAEAFAKEKGGNVGTLTELGVK